MLGLALLIGCNPAHAATVPHRVTGTTLTTVSHQAPPHALPLTVGARSSIPSSRHSAFPGAARLADGRLLAVWREGTEHLSKDGDIWGSYSADNGQTWTAETTRLVMPGFDLRDPSLALIDGVLYMTFCVSQPGLDGVGVYVATSTDDGLSWTVGPRVDGGMARAAESGPVVEVGGRLLQVFYGHPAGETRYSLFYATSSDHGRSWDGVGRILDGTADGRDYLEPWPVQVPGGPLRVFARWDSATSIGSVDFDGVSWSNAHAWWAGSGRPACVANGAKVLCVYRRLDPAYVDRPGLARLSIDGGVTFGAPVVLDGRGAMFTYAAPVTSGSGWVVPYSLQTAPNASRMYVRAVGRA